jgi:hypothetical protein
MTAYPLEFHRRSERQWVRRAQASQSSEALPGLRLSRPHDRRPGDVRPDISISLLLNRSALAAGSAKKCRT